MKNHCIPILFILGFLLIPGAFGAADETMADPVPTGSWHLNAYRPHHLNMIPVLNGTGITADFSPDGTLTGNAGCNAYWAEYTTGSGAILVGQMATTRMACTDEVMKQEAAYLELIPEVYRAEMTDTLLTLFDDHDHDILVYSPAGKEDSSFSLSDSPLTLVSYLNGDKYQNALEGTGASVTFSSDGTISGNFGCNSIGGSYSYDADTITFGPLMMTLMACDGPVVEQEAAMVRVLSGTVQYFVTDGELVISDEDRILALFRIQN